MGKEYLVYLVGVCIFGLVYYEIKFWLDNDFIFVIGGVVYLIFLRVLAKKVT